MLVALLITFLVVVLVLYLINMLPLDPQAVMIAREGDCYSDRHRCLTKIYLAALVPKPLRYQRDREHETQRLRGRKAVAQRLRRLRQEPLCRDCSDRGLVTAATTPDHIIPLSRGGSDDDSNIRCLCDSCHQVRTAQQFGFAKAPVGDDGWPT